MKPHIVLLSAAVVVGCRAEPRVHADLVLFGGHVITVDSNDRVAEAVAVVGKRIVAVGSTREIVALAGPHTERVDLAGRTVTPGLLDAHAHFGWAGADRLYVVDLSYPNVESVSDVVRKVAERAATAPAGTWIVGQGWDEGKLSELRYVLAADLDAVTPDHPVWLGHTMGHYGTANARALSVAGIGRSTRDPPGGTIDRLRNGAPSGVLKEAAQNLVIRHIPPMTPDQQRNGMRELARAFNEECMTGLKDPGIDVETWSAYQDVLAAGDLTVRVFALWSVGETLAAAEQLIQRVGPFTKPYITTGDDRLVSGGVKLFADGSGGARTAWVYDEWNRNSREVDTGNRGYPAVDPTVLRAQIRAFHDAGFHVAVHAIGDRAIDWVVDSYAAALTALPVSGRRHSIIHANIPTDRALDGMAELQRTYDAGYPEPSATFMWWIGDTYAGNFGPDRAGRLNPFRSYRDRGMRWAAGSDYNVTPFPARFGIWAAVTRETLLGVYGKTPWGLEEAVDVRSALRSHTIWAARQMFLDRSIGSVEVGKYADLAVWDRNLLDVPASDLKDLQCAMTVFDGSVVFRRGA